MATAMSLTGRCRISIGELVKDGQNGRTFRTAEELSALLAVSIRDMVFPLKRRLAEPLGVYLDASRRLPEQSYERARFVEKRNQDRAVWRSGRGRAVGQLGRELGQSGSPSAGRLFHAEWQARLK